MAGKWDWLKDEIGGFKVVSKLPVILKFLRGKSGGPDDIIKCTLCPNMCRHACPVGIIDGKETTSPSGKSKIGLLLREKITNLDGFSLQLTGVHFNEFVIQSRNNPIEVNKVLLKHDIQGGIPIESWYPSLKNSLLFGITELHSTADIDKLISILKGVDNV